MSRKKTAAPAAASLTLAILVIDDDPENCRLLAEALTSEQQQVVAVGSAEEGLAQLPYHTFSVAFIDHYLPRMDGLTLCGYLRRASPLLEVVLMTGAESRQLRHAAQEEGIRFLSKPLNLEEVQLLVEEQRAELTRRGQQPLRPPTSTRPPLVGTLLEEVAAELALPAVPDRLKDALFQRLKEALSRLRSRSHFEERDRLLLYAGIVTLRTLHLPLPRVMDGRTLAEEYDRLMLKFGLPCEFTSSPEEQ